jgi:tetratricopeptide (TPR) repeat protein
MELKKKLVFAWVPVLILALFLETGLWLTGMEPSIRSEDPYVGFAAELPLFELEQGTGGDTRFRTAQNKLRFFNDQSFPAHKDSGVRRVFCLGGSTTYGRPYRDITSFCGWLRTYLPAVAPETSWEVINAGGISYASYRVVAVMEELLQYEPDLFIVYSGHNEFLEERTYRSLRAQPEALRWLDLKLRETRIYTALQSAMTLAGPAEGSSQSHDELSAEVKTRLDSSIGPASYHRDDSLKAAVLAHYRVNLVRMASLARHSGTELIAIAPADNLLDSSPFKSEVDASLTDAERDDLEDLLDRAEQLLYDENFAAAQSLFERALSLDARHAAAHYGLGRALVALGEVEQGEQHLIRARDEDVVPLRAISQIGEIARQVALEENVSLVDFESLMASAPGPAQRPRGADWFLDHVHPTIEGHRRLAVALLGKVEELGWFEAGLSSAAPRMAEAEALLLSGVDPQEHGIALRNLAKVLSWSGKDRDAARAAKRAVAALKGDSESYFILALGASKRRDHTQAVAFLKEALQIDPSWSKARNNLGVELMRAERPEEALLVYDELLRREPDHASAHFNRANALSKLGQLEEAAGGYRTALEFDASDIDARFNLARVYRRAGESTLAIEELKVLLEVDREDPEVLDEMKLAQIQRETFEARALPQRSTPRGSPEAQPSEPVWETGRKS